MNLLYAYNMNKQTITSLIYQHSGSYCRTRLFAVVMTNNKVAHICMDFPLRKFHLNSLFYIFYIVLIKYRAMIFNIDILRKDSSVVKQTVLFC